jgi:hypothetical protein
MPQPTWTWTCVLQPPCQPLAAAAHCPKALAPQAAVLPASGGILIVHTWARACVDAGCRRGKPPAADIEWPETSRRQRRAP